MDKRYAIILAAGQGTRMKSKLYKVLHPVAGKPMVQWVLEQVQQTKPETIVTVVGHGADAVRQFLGSASEYALQAEQLGTGHAVLQTKELLGDRQGTTLVICGDTPLLTGKTIEALFSQHQKTNAKATVLTAKTANPYGYGRVVRDAAGLVEKIVEQKDATPAEQAIEEINVATYCFDNQALFKALEQVTNDNAQGEYYLPDVLHILRQAGEPIAAYQMEDFSEALGINDRVALAQANQLMRNRINRQHMEAGVSLLDPSQTYIDADVKIGADTVIEPGVLLKGKTIIGSDCLIGAHSEIRDCVIEDGVTVTASLLEQSKMSKNSNIGPYSHLRPASEIGVGVHIGNFVEVKKAKLAEGTKVGHLTYIGDAELGKNINVGCGTIFVNYDGKNKHQIKVGDNSFIGCNANLIAPVEIGENSFVAAGSTITKNVPAEALAIARSRQENKENYAKKLPYSQ